MAAKGKPIKGKAKAKPKAAAKKAPPKKRGRPDSFTQEKADAVCELVATGHSLRQIEAMPGMPAKVTILKWLGRDQEFATHYARARELQAEHMAEELLEIADDARNDFMERAAADGSTSLVVDHEHIARSKLRYEARRWLMGKMAPKKYGDKIDHTVNGRLEHVSSLSDADLERILAPGSRG